MNTPPPFTLRIRTQNDEDIDWMVQPDEITFHQALEVISKVQPQSTITAFEYDDEDEERITVRSDEEMKAMFQMYFSILSEHGEEDLARGLLPPLVIFPRVGKTPQNRNIHGLTILTKKESPPKIAEQPMVRPPVQNSSHHMETKDLKDLMCGNILETDLQYLELLGTGNGGRVSRALHRPSGKSMAVKVMQLDVDIDMQKQIISEMEILYKCHSPAIIGFYGAFFMENRISICTEFMDGGSLDKYGPVPEPVLGRMSVYIVQGLQYMWELKILHRDIKPSNILVSTRGEVKLCDFGVSVQLVESIARTYVGTNAFMAPERIRGEEYSSPAEVWSFGVSLFELATGNFPFGCPSSFSTPVQLLDAITGRTLPVLQDGVFSPELIDFVSRCMQRVPNQRLAASSLDKHPYIQKFNDGNRSVIAMWVQSKLPYIAQRKQPP
ncbi:hypothetical protein ScPMuIL_017649 [Solemya velum]